ncbi:MAG TPA: OB-fold domain-containing protein [Acidimicrobiales bacterium]|nr:OB-fold domain-containing protein [Acidimicrobiales bacterium]
MSERVAVRDGLFVDAEPPRLLGSHCRRCGRHHFPRHVVCPYCASEEVEAAELSGRGRLWAHTAVTAPPPGYRGEVPFGFGVVELTTEALRIVTRLTVADPAALDTGDPMELVVVPLHVDDEGRQVVTYAFAPEGAAAAPEGGAAAPEAAT